MRAEGFYLTNDVICGRTDVIDDDGCASGGQGKRFCASQTGAGAGDYGGAAGEIVGFRVEQEMTPQLDSERVRRSIRRASDRKEKDEVALYRSHGESGRETYRPLSESLSCPAGVGGALNPERKSRGRTIRELFGGVFLAVRPMRRRPQGVS